MQRNYRLVISIFSLGLLSIGAFAQETVEYKDVFLDGKPAKLNVATGEVKLVNPADKAVKSTTDYTQQNNNSNQTYIIVDSDYYIVKEGETLYDVSKKYNVALNDLKRANNLETTLINKGQRLRVSNLDVLGETESISSNYTHPESTYSDNNYSSDYYIVERGNTLFSLANRFGLTVNELKRINNITSNTISVGQRLRVNGSENTYVASNSSFYVVKNGDNLYRIALNNGTTVNELKRLNGLSSNLITVGQELQLR